MRNCIFHGHVLSVTPSRVRPASPWGGAGRGPQLLIGVLAEALQQPPGTEKVCVPLSLSVCVDYSIKEGNLFLALRHKPRACRSTNSAACGLAVAYDISTGERTSQLWKHHQDIE